MFRNNLKNHMWLNPSLPTGGSAPTIPTATQEEHSNRGFLFKPFQVAPWSRTSQSGQSPSNNSARNSETKKSTNSHRIPIVPIGVPRAASAENRGGGFPWTQNNSPCLGPGAHHLKAPPKFPTSSELSLCSSTQNSEVFPVPNPLEQQSLEIVMPKGQPHAIALYDFDTHTEGDLQFKTGDLILLEEIVDEAWYRGRSVATGQVGIFPMNHVEVRIPLDTGLYTAAQPKPALIVPPMMNGVRSRISPSESVATDGEQSPPLANLPRRPSRIRINSLSSKFGSPPKESEIKSNAVNNGASTNELNARFPVPYQPHTQTDNSKNSSDSNHSETPSSDSVKNDLLPTIRASTPTIIHSLRPRSQVSVSQLAECLEQQGVTVNRVRPMPAGARPLYPNSVRVLGTSAPPERHKVNSHVGAEDVTPTKSVAFPTPQMVETPLVLLARERQRQLAKEAEQYVKRTQSRLEAESPPKVAPHINGQDTIDENGGQHHISSIASDTNLFSKPAPLLSEPTNTLNDSDPLIPLKDHQPHRQASFVSRMAFPSDDQVRTNGLTNGHHHHHERKVVSSIADDHVYNQLRSNVRSSPESYDQSNMWNGGGGRTSKTPTYSSDPSDEAYGTLKMDKPHQVFHRDGDKKLVSEPEEQSHQWLLVLYDYIGTEPGDLTVKAGNVIRCLDPLPKPATIYDVNLPERWLHCVTWFNVEGQVPSTFARRIADPEELKRWMKYRPRAEVLFEFNAQTAGDLHLKVGDVVYLHDSVDSNWYRGENAVTGECGIFPSPFVHVLCPL